MDKYLCRKDVFDDIEKAMRDRSHLTQKKITDKNGKQRTVWVRPGENSVADKGKKAEDTTEKQSAKPKYSVGDKVTLDGAKGDFKVSSIDKDGTYHVVSADGKKGYKVSKNHIIQSGKKTKITDADRVEGAFETKLQNSKKDIAEDNLIKNLSKKVEFTDEQMKAINDVFGAGKYKEGDATKILNDLYYENKDVYNQLQNMNNQIWEESKEKSKTFSSVDLIKEKIEDLLKSNKLKAGGDSGINSMTDKDFFDKYNSIIPSEGRYGTPETRISDIKREIEFQEYMKNNGSSGYSQNKHEVLKEALKRLEGNMGEQIS